MPTRNALRGVLAGFLGTFTSRYSDYDGYWLFGFLVLESEIIIDLLGDASDDASPPLRAARELARMKFREQLGKSGLPRSTVQRASLYVERPPTPEEGLAGNWRRSGFGVRFRAIAVADNGRSYQREEVVFVAPHDPRFESRSARATA